MTALSVPAWHELASCQYVDPDLFFPEGDEIAEAVVIQSDQARRICLGCPVRRECLVSGLKAREPYGTWGGLSQRELLAETRRQPARMPEEILAWADKRYFRRQERALRAEDRRLAEEERMDKHEAFLGLVA